MSSRKYPCVHSYYTPAGSRFSTVSSSNHHRCRTLAGTQPERHCSNPKVHCSNPKVALQDLQHPEVAPGGASFGLLQCTFGLLQCTLMVACTTCATAAVVTGGYTDAPASPHARASHTPPPTLNPQALTTQHPRVWQRDQRFTAKQLPARLQ